MGTRDPAKMTPKAWIAFEAYRDLGPARSLRAAAEKLGYSPRSMSLFDRWQRRYDWGRRIAKHDHAELREALGLREIARERTLQTLCNAQDLAAAGLIAIITNDEKLPIFDRHGDPVKDNKGKKLYKLVVKASTRLEAQKTLLGLTGLVPVKRTEHVDRTAEGLDRAANVLQSMSPKQIEQLMVILDSEPDAP